jgi:exodeoxyribonuclease VII small subunit
MVGSPPMPMTARSQVATTDPMPDGPAAVETLAFDDALAELQRVVGELEAGGQPLEAELALYERGVALQARCERLIGDAELRVQQLVARAGGALETRDVQVEEATEASE